MRKTRQLSFVSNGAEDIIEQAKNKEEVVGTLYFYYCEITVDRTCQFLVGDSSMEAYANKPLIIRTPIKVLKSLTRGAKISIVYEIGDAPTGDAREVREIIGNGALNTNSKSIIGAVNEVYAMKGGTSNNTPPPQPQAPTFENEAVLKTITADKVGAWDKTSKEFSELQKSVVTVKSSVPIIELLPFKAMDVVVSLRNGVRIMLPQVTEYTECKVCFLYDNSVTINLPNDVYWSNTPPLKFENGRIYEILFTYQSRRWTGGVIEYEK